MILALAALFLVLIAVGLALLAFTIATARQVEAQIPPRGRFLTLDGARLHYVDTGGSGPPIVMIHGLGGNLLNFDYALAGRLSDAFRLILIDRPGAGYSTRPEDGDASINAQAATIAQLIRTLKLEKPLVVGHSLGGAVALGLALHHGDCVGGLALFAPLTHPIPEVPEVFQGLLIKSAVARRLVAWLAATPLGKLSGPNVQKVAFAPETPTPDFDLRAGGALMLRPSAFYAASSDAVAVDGASALADNVKLYPSLAVPIAILFGKGDRLLDYRLQGETMKTLLPALEFELTEGGHMLPLTMPDRCAEIIRGVAAQQRVPAVAG